MTPRYLSLLEDKSILIITEVYYGYGDLFAALKIIKSILNSTESLHIDWVVITTNDPHSIEQKCTELLLEFADKMSMQVFSSKQLLDLNHILKPNLIYLYPTVHYLSRATHFLLKQFEVPIVHAYEYDGMEYAHLLDFKSELALMQTGFGGLGLNLLEFETKQELDPEVELFFSYQGNNHSVVNKASFKKYLKIALEISNPAKSIEVVTNSDVRHLSENLFSLIWSHGFTEVEIVTNDRNNAQQVETVPVPESKRKGIGHRKLKLLNEFPLSNAEMLNYMRKAHPFIHITGDQSFSEALSLAGSNPGVFPFYQMMSWKINLYHNWLEYAESCLGKNSAYVTLLKMLNQNLKIDALTFARYWRENMAEILQGSKVIYLRISKEKNLARNTLLLIAAIFKLQTNSFTDKEYPLVRVIALLITKLQDLDHILQFVKEIQWVDDDKKRSALIKALSEFLTLYTSPLTIIDLRVIKKQLLEFNEFSMSYAAHNARRILGAMPENFRIKNLHKVLPTLLKYRESDVKSIIEYIENANLTNDAEVDAYLYDRLISNATEYSNVGKDAPLTNSILLCVYVYPDGFGDLAKFIGVYHELSRRYPHTVIISLVHCLASDKVSIIEMMRSAGIPMQSAFVCITTTIEMLTAAVDINNREVYTRQYDEVSFNYTKRFGLIISLATPIPAINRILRDYHDSPYIDLGEDNFASHMQYPQLLRSMDSNHHLHCMGLNNNSVGMEFVEFNNKTLPQLLGELSPTLVDKLFGMQSINELADVLFMPAYVKNDSGALSFDIILNIMHHYPDKQHAVIWMPKLTLDIHSKNFIKRCESVGFKEIVYINVDGVSNVKRLNMSNSQYGQLRVVEGIVSPDDFDLLFQIAKYLGGFAGVCGQNSFEKAVSCDLLPVFCSPSWQTAILWQVIDVMQEVFAVDSPLYKMIINYYGNLISISTSLNKIENLKTSSYYRRYKYLLDGLPLQEMIEKFRDLNAEIPNDNIEQLLNPIAESAFENMIRFFKNTDLRQLINAWQKTCHYLKKNKNLYVWLNNMVEMLLPVVHQPVAKETFFDIAPCADIKYEYPYVVCERDSRIHAWLMSILPEKYKTIVNRVQFIYTSAPGIFVEIVPGFSSITIALGQLALELFALEDLRFGLELSLSVAKLYPVENYQISINKLRPDEVLNLIGTDLDAGLRYCQILCAYYKEHPHQREVTNKLIEFYKKLAKLIGIELANLHKQDLHTQMIPVTPLPPEIINDFNDYKFTSIQDTKSFDVIEEIKLLIEMMPGLVVSDSTSYYRNKLKASQLIERLKKVDIKTDDIDQFNLAEQLIKAAYQYKLPIFNNIYEIISQKLYSGIKPLGIFKELATYINQFEDAATSSDALMLSEKIELFLEEHYTLFLHDYSLDRLLQQEIKSSQVPLTKVFSSFGRSIHWHEAFSEERYSVLANWALESDNESCARLLFRLGYVADKRLWLKISDEYIRKIEGDETPCKFLGPVQGGYFFRSDHPLSVSFVDDYLHHRFCANISPLELPLTIASFDNFIDANFRALAIPDISEAAAKILMAGFVTFTEENPADAKYVITRFFTDQNSHYSLKRLLEDRHNLGFRRGKFSSSYTDSSRYEEKIAYIDFLENQDVSYLPIHDLLGMLDEVFVSSVRELSGRFYLKAFNIDIKELADVSRAIELLNRNLPIIANRWRDNILAGVLCAICWRGIPDIPKIDIFSREVYAYLQAVSGTEASNYAIGYLWSNQSFHDQFNAPLSVSADVHEMAFIYQAVDEKLGWYKAEFREPCTTLLVATLQSCDHETKLKICEMLLFKSSPLSDFRLIQDLITIWCDCQLHCVGLDNQSYAYFKTVTHLIQGILNRCPSLYVQDVLEQLTTVLMAQREVCEYIYHSLNPKNEDPKALFNKSDVLVTMANAIAREDLSQSVVRFLTVELSQNSVKTLINQLDDRSARIFMYKRSYNGDMNEARKQILVTSFYHAFWSQTLETRAVIINNLLMPSDSTVTAKAMQDSYEKAFKFAIDQLFTDKSEETLMSIALLESYLVASHMHFRPYLLAAILTANKCAANSARNVEHMLPKLAESLGPAGVKAGQAAHSYPGVPRHIRDSLAYLKSRARMPYRWELMRWIEATLPAADLEHIDKVLNVLGGASFYVAVEVCFKDGRTQVLRLLRQNARQEAEHGFNHLREAVKLCRHPGIQNIAHDLCSILDEAQRGTYIEVDHQCAIQQYAIAKSLYNNCHASIVHENITFDIQIQAVQLFSCGEGFQLISRADGIEFNELKKNPEYKIATEAIAMAVYRNELIHLLGDLPCDVDRHGAQSRVQIVRSGQQSYRVLVTHYDFGEINPAPSTAKELYHCHAFINELATTLFSNKNLLMLITNYISIKEYATEIPKMMFNYLREREQTIPANELTRLRRFLKGLLALNDYFEALPNNRQFFLELNALFTRHVTSPSVTAVILSFFASGYGTSATSPDKRPKH